MLFWPGPPAEPRIDYVKSFSSARDLGMKGSTWQNFVRFFSGNDDSATRMDKPFAVAVDSDGNICVTDLGLKAVFCLFVVLGCSVQLDAVLDFSDALVFLICVPNLIGLYWLQPVIEERLRSYEWGRKTRP